MHRQIDDRQKVISIVHPEYSSGELKTVAFGVVVFVCDMPSQPHVQSYKVL